MNLKILSLQAEKLRKNVIGDPDWRIEKNVFEYPEQSIEVIAILKLLRAIQGVQTQKVLCDNGLFIDMGAIFRCVNDCVEEIRFILEKYPKQSQHVKQFIKNFFEHTIGNHLSVETPSVLKKKIRSANVRFFKNEKEYEKIRLMLENIYKAHCGYIHANYSHIMQSYGGPPIEQSFNLLGCPSEEQKAIYLQMVEESYSSVLYSMHFICFKFKQEEIVKELEKLLKEK